MVIERVPHVSLYIVDGFIINEVAFNVVFEY